MASWIPDVAGSSAGFWNLQQLQHSLIAANGRRDDTWFFLNLIASATYAGFDSH